MRYHTVLPQVSRFSGALLMFILLAPYSAWPDDPNLLVSLIFSPQSVQAGAPTMGTVTMQGPAPAKGRVLYLSSSNPNLVPVPPSITVPGGSAIGTFTVRPNSAPGSTGEVTISVSTKPPLISRFSSSTQGVLGRGLEEPSRSTPGAQQTEGQSELRPIPETTVEQTVSEDEQVTERGITSLQITKQFTPPPVATSPPTATAKQGLALQINPRPADKTDLPGDTKSAVIFVQLPLGLQLPSK